MRHAARGSSACAAGLFGSLVACAQASDRDRFGSDAEPLEIVATMPEPDAREVPPRSAIELCFSHLIDPRSIGEQSVEIRSGDVRYDSNLVLQLFAFRTTDDDAPWCPGSVLSVQTRSPLMAETVHRAVIDRRIRGWDGERLAPEGPGWFVDRDGVDRFGLEFEVGPADPEGTDPPEGTEPAPRLRDLFAPGALFDPARATCGCHRGEDERARTLLDLGSHETAYRDLVVETRPRDTGFPMITPYRSAESFFLHKLLRDPDEGPLLGVLGQPMPEDDEPLSHAELVQLARWIEGGAKP